MKIAVGSLKFNPVFKSLCLALGKQCEKNGFEVTYLFSEQYRWMLPKEIVDKTVFISTSARLSLLFQDYFKKDNHHNIRNLMKNHNLSAIYMFNYHPLNHKIADLCQNSNIKYIQHIHETSSDPTNFKLGYGYLLRFFYIHLICKLLKKTDMAIVSSQKVYNSFHTMCPKFTGIVKLIPLMFEDSGVLENSNLKYSRRYVTFVGPPIPTKNVELFYNIVNYSIENDLDYRFLLISRKKVRVDHKLLSKMDVYCKSKITDEEIGDLLQSSIVTITPYTNISQSSNVMTSYKYGTPVLASNILGMKQFVFPQRTGCLVDLKSPIEKWINSLGFISDNFDMLSENCKHYYETNLSESNWNKYLDIFDRQYDIDF
jgi:glycosyltransferase involved in cell wall biosynthesis